MACTPKPTDSEPRGLHIRPKNDAFLKERSGELRRNYTETFNSEMEFPLSANVSETATPEEFTVQGDGVVSHVSVYQR